MSIPSCKHQIIHPHQITHHSFIPEVVVCWGWSAASPLSTRSRGVFGGYAGCCCCQRCGCIPLVGSRKVHPGQSTVAKVLPVGATIAPAQQAMQREEPDA